MRQHAAALRLLLQSLEMSAPCQAPLGTLKLCPMSSWVITSSGLKSALAPPFFSMSFSSISDATCSS